MNEIEKLNERITYLEGVIAGMVKTGSYTFRKDVLFYDGIEIREGQNIVLDATTGTQIGTANTQKLGLWGTTPVVQPTAIANVASGASDSDGVARTAINSILARLRLPGFIDT